MNSMIGPDRCVCACGSTANTADTGQRHSCGWPPTESAASSSLASSSISSSSGRHVSVVLHSLISSLLRRLERYDICGGQAGRMPVHRGEQRPLVARVSKSSAVETLWASTLPGTWCLGINTTQATAYHVATIPAPSNTASKASNSPPLP
jgi:hypothetical protein